MEHSPAFHVKMGIKWRDRYMYDKGYFYNKKREGTHWYCYLWYIHNLYIICYVDFISTFANSSSRCRNQTEYYKKIYEWLFQVTRNKMISPLEFFPQTPKFALARAHTHTLHTYTHTQIVASGKCAGATKGIGRRQAIPDPEVLHLCCIEQKLKPGIPGILGSIN